MDEPKGELNNRMSERNKSITDFDRNAFVERRKELGYSRNDLARLARVSATTVRGWELGIAKPTARSLAAAADVLNTTIEDLMLETNAPPTLSTLRQRCGLTQPDLSEATGIGASTISRVERGETPLTEEMTETIADALGVAPLQVTIAWNISANRPPGKL